jgi:hypothetical protein
MSRRQVIWPALSGALTYAGVDTATWLLMPGGVMLPATSPRRAIAEVSA